MTSQTKQLPPSVAGWNLKDYICNADSEMSKFKAVVIGGGSGSPVSIKTLLGMGVQTSTVVSMADDGGSTGILREDAHVIPPGDIRKCLVAMALDSSDEIVQMFQYRFDYIQDHALGNLILTALADISSHEKAIEICKRLLNAQGDVYPSTLDWVTMSSQTRDGKIINGQASTVHSDAAARRVWIDQDSPKAYGPALDAIKAADLIVLGPGSLFTSVIPNLLIPGIVEAIAESNAKTLFLCSLADEQGETLGLNCAEHLQALLAHGMEGLLDYVAVASECRQPSGDVIRPKLDDAIKSQIALMAPHVIEAAFVDPQCPSTHSPRALELLFREVLG